MLPALVAFVALAEGVRDQLRDAGLVTATVIATAAVLRILFAKRSPLRRVPLWVGRRLVSDPLSAKASTFLESFVERVVTPKIDAVHAELSAISDRNDAQHAAVEARLARVETAVGDQNSKLDEQNSKLVDLAAQILKHPGLPLNTGETPITVKESTT